MIVIDKLRAVWDIVASGMYRLGLGRLMMSTLKWFDILVFFNQILFPITKTSIKFVLDRKRMLHCNVEINYNITILLFDLYDHQNEWSI